VVGKDPDVGGDAGVVEHVGGQRDDGLDEVVLEQIAADFRLAGARAAGEERRAIELGGIVAIGQMLIEI
jgi:hypothetical protein